MSDSDILTDSFVMVSDNDEISNSMEIPTMEEFILMSDVEENDDDDSEGSEEMEEQLHSKYLGIRPDWVPDKQVLTCKRCNNPFTFFKRRHHCRFCGNIFCNDCCHVKASYPVWFGYECPQRVCEICIPSLFDSRQKSPKQKSKSLRHSSSNSVIKIDGFETSGQEVLSFPLRFLHPLCKFAFWFSGMYEGGAFNRTYLNTAASMNIPFVSEQVKSIVKAEVPVPKKWPSYGNEECYSYSISSYDELQLQNIPVFIFTPLTHDDKSLLPILVWYHGGGFCLGSAENLVYQTICSSLANRTNCIVVSVEYRLAPEFKFPTQIEDAYAALKWVHSKAETFGGDPNNIAVGGDSAGGSLSAVLSILSRDRNFPVALKHQLLVYPCITNPLTDDLDSHVKYKEGPVLSRTVCEWFMKQVFDNVEEGLNHPFASPLLIESHANLPPATIINALHDPLCDHGKLYVQKLRKDGIPATRSVYRKSLHGFFGSSLGESTEAIVEASTALKNAFSS